MTVMGTMKNGVIVPDDTATIPEGTRVQIRSDPAEVRGFTIADLQAFGMPILKEDYPGEFDDIYRSMKKWQTEELRVQEQQDRQRELPE